MKLLKKNKVETENQVKDDKVTMRKLTVVHKYKDSLKLNLGNLPQDTSVVSLEEGAGRAKIPAGEKFDLVVFQKCDSADDMVTYTERLERFHNDLSAYNIIHSNTVIL